MCLSVSSAVGGGDVDGHVPHASCRGLTLSREIGIDEDNDDALRLLVIATDVIDTCTYLR